MVASYLRNYQYQLELAPVSDSMDPVEFFLSQSYAGYCVHFASAGVLILRELGIPARYATGYIVHPSEWKKQEDGSYQAVVLDRQAHAWAEVYLSGFGWVPVEMTAGIGTEEEGEPLGDLTSLEDKKTEQKKKRNQKEAKNTEEPKTTIEPTETPEAVPSGQSETKGTDGKQNKNDGMFFVGIVGGIFCASGICFGIFLYTRKRKQMGHSMEEGRSRNQLVICGINRAVYKKLRRKHPLSNWNLSDRMYEEHLKKTYPQVEENRWEHFMELVKKARFSKEEMTEEEIAFCRGIYRAM